MATTPNYSWVMPAPTDFVTDLPADFETFGDAVDASLYALSPGTTAGDVDYYTSSTAKARLGIGTAGQVLQVNSGATAPEWATPAGAKNFSLLNAGGTALTGASTITVSGISGMDSIMVLVNGARATSTSQLVVFQFNSDTGNNYTALGVSYNSAAAYAASNLERSGSFNSDKFRTATTSGNANSTMDIGLFISGANTSGLKMIQATAAAEAATSNGNRMIVQNGYYKGTSAISSISIITDSNFNSGTMYIYGSA
jgi:hypothetical protein